MSLNNGSNDVDRTVMVVDDEPNVTDTYAMWLEGHYDVMTAYSGDEALEKMDDTVDVVLLDRRMPVMSGDEVLKRIRDQGYDTRVVMVTAVKPDFDIVEMGCDDYLVKPVSREKIFESLENVIRLNSYTDDLSEYYSLVSKRSALEDEKPVEDLKNSDTYAELVSRIESLEKTLDIDRKTVDTEGFIAATREIMRESVSGGANDEG